MPLVRFSFLAQKASDVVQEVKSLGANLLAAMEKEDGEALAVLRARHERVVMELVEQIKYGQLQEAVKSKENLLQTMAAAVQRYVYYERQLGRKAEDIEKSIPALADLDAEGLAKLKLKADEPEISRRELEVDIAQDLGASGGRIVSSHEQQELVALEAAAVAQITATVLEAIGGVLAIVPQFEGSGEPMGCGAAVSFGGQHLHSLMSSQAGVVRAFSESFSYQANKAAKIGSYARREQDWAFQSNVAAGEINQIFKQIRAASPRGGFREMKLRTIGSR